MKRRHTLLLAIIFVQFTGRLAAQNDAIVVGDQVLNTHEVTQGIDITYLIRFQNVTGETAAAVTVRDTLDPQITASTFAMVDASHAFTFFQNGDVLTWTFNDIQLPDSSQSRDASKGYLVFRVQPRHDIKSGQYIRHKAFIYFDLKPSVPTNEAIVWVGETGPTNEPAAASLRIFPNPNSGEFQLAGDFSEGGLPPISILDADGRAVDFSQNSNGEVRNSRLFLRDIKPGVYFLRTVVGGEIRVEPFVVVN